jgi:hypothetical protein
LQIGVGDVQREARGKLIVTSVRRRRSLSEQKRIQRVLHVAGFGVSRVVPSFRRASHDIRVGGWEHRLAHPAYNLTYADLSNRLC